MSQSSRKLIFHIGHHKTGSTAIQDALAAGLFEVDGRAPLYPGAFNHNYLARHFTAYSESARLLPPDRQMPNLDQIAKALAQGDFQYAVISGESFSVTSPAIAADVMRKFMLPHVQDHSILCYVRPHAARTLSGFVEQTKVGFFEGASIAEFHKSGPRNGRFRFVPNLRAWADTFGEHFLTRPFHRDFLKNASVLDDFADQAFAGSSICIHEQKSSNESSSLEDLVLLRFVQSFLRTRSAGLRLQLGWTLTLALDARARGVDPVHTGKGREEAVMDVVDELVSLISAARGPVKTKVALDRQTAEDIRSTYLNDARILDQTVFAATPLMTRELDRAVETAIDKPQSLEPSDYHSADTLRQIASRVGELDVKLGKDGSRWMDYFLRRRIEGVQKGSVMRSRTSAQEAPDVTPVVVPGVLNVARLDRMVSAALTEGDGFNMLSRKLNNAYMAYEPKNTHIEPKDLIARIAQGGPASDVLKEYLVVRFFQRNIEELGGAAGRVMAPRGQASRDLADILPALTEQHVAMLEGGLAYIRKDFKSAYKTFDAARKAVISTGTARHHNRGVLSLRLLETLQHWAHGTFGALTPAPLAKPDFLSDTPFPTDRPIVMVGMDRVYYDRYAPRLVESARPWANLHFHIVNPGDGPLLSEPHVRYSVETAINPVTGYYASLRFLHLQACLDHYQRPLVTGDADAFFDGSPQPAVSFARGMDVAVTTSHDLKLKRAFLASMPWRMVMANVFVANQTTGAARFLSTYANIYRGLAADDPTGPHWWVDQALLSIVTDILEPEGVKIAKGWLFPKSGMTQQKL